VSESSPVVVEPENNPDALELADRLDPAIGETSAVVGAMLTELLRRTLRGGVLRIGDEMHGYVTDKLDTAIAERTPGLERLAAEVAEHAARTAATEVATEEVHALEQRTQASNLELAGKITEAARAAEQRAREAAEALAGKITETAQTAEQRTREAAEALTGKITETAQTAEQRTREAAEALTGKITETAQTAEQRTREAAEALATQINETEQRGQAALQEQVQTLVERSHERSERLKARFAAQEKRIASLGKDLARMVQESQAELRAALHKLEEEKQSLVARVEELEKPRGLRALWLRLFGRHAAKPVVDA
jgi:chromosome segregation ATPase